jgi:hypothetical protein
VPRTQGFNVFEVLRIDQLEIPHSNFLKFTLDPANFNLLFLDPEMMRGQEDCFLKAVLKDLLERATRSGKLPPSFPIAAGDVDATKLEGVEVEREPALSASAPPVTSTDDLFAEVVPDASRSAASSTAKRVDLLISCKQPRFFVVIENKIRAPEGDGQLTSYEEGMKRKYPEDQPLYVYMTPKGMEPHTNPSWMVYRHAYLANVVQGIREQFQTSIRADVLAILDHFLELNRERLESVVVEAEEPDDDCWLMRGVSEAQRSRHYADAEKNPEIVAIRDGIAGVETRLDALEKEFNALIDLRHALRQQAENTVNQIVKMAIKTEAKQDSYFGELIRRSAGQDERGP